MPRILMILTSHRLDCFRLAMDFLFASGSLPDFERVVLMLNGVKGRHLRYVESMMREHPDIAWDTVSGPRGKGPLVANLQNEVVKRYPNRLYYKIDEDVFVPRNWHNKLYAAYEQFGRDDNLALITGLIPNNALGFSHLMSLCPDLSEAYEKRFAMPVDDASDGTVWHNPYVAEMAIRHFIELESSNQRLCELSDVKAEPYVKFAKRFSINCLLYDYRHWEQMGGIPDDEEPAWGRWVPDHGKFNILVRNMLVQHYSFFVQQDWLDRTTLLEDFRRVNLPDTYCAAAGMMARCARLIQQAPRILKRRLSLS